MIQIGYKAAERNAEALERLSLSPQEWDEYLQDKNARRHLVPDTGNLVAVRSSQPSIQKSATHELEHKLSGGPVSEDKLETNLTGLTAATGLPGAFYTWNNDPQRQGFRVELESRPDHELLFRPSAFYQISQGEPGRATLRLNTTRFRRMLTSPDFLPTLFIGYDPGARFEYYHPFDGSSLLSLRDSWCNASTVPFIRGQPALTSPAIEWAAHSTWVQEPGGLFSCG